MWYLVVAMMWFLRGDVTVLEALGLLGINLSCGLVVLLSLNTESMVLLYDEYLILTIIFIWNLSTLN